jgi:hypothetical protein
MSLLLAALTNSVAFAISASGAGVATCESVAAAVDSIASAGVGSATVSCSSESSCEVFQSGESTAAASGHATADGAFVVDGQGIASVDAGGFAYAALAANGEGTSTLTASAFASLSVVASGIGAVTVSFVEVDPAAIRMRVTVRNDVDADGVAAVGIDISAPWLAARVDSPSVNVFAPPAIAIAPIIRVIRDADPVWIVETTIATRTL